MMLMRVLLLLILLLVLLVGLLVRLLLFVLRTSRVWRRSRFGRRGGGGCRGTNIGTIRLIQAGSIATAIPRRRGDCFRFF